MAFISYLNPFKLFRDFIRTPVEAFVLQRYIDYKIRTNKGINSAKELLYQAGIVTVFVTAILWISVFMYVVFYYTYMPNVTHVRPVHLQFKSCEEQMGICSFPSAHVQLTKRSHMLMSAQPYRIRLILEMPESDINKELGMFMVCAQMRAKGGVLVSSSCRSAMLRHRAVKACTLANDLERLGGAVYLSPHHPLQKIASMPACLTFLTVLMAILSLVTLVQIQYGRVQKMARIRKDL